MYRIFLQETFVVVDAIEHISGSIDESNKFDNYISLRNNGTSTISYDSTNKYYILNITKTDSESFIPIGSITGLDNIIIEFDGYLTGTASFIGLTFYKDNSNWGRLGAKSALGREGYEFGTSINGSYSESDITGYAPPKNTWLHYKFTITNNTIHRQVYNEDTLIYEDTRTYTGFFTSTTKYGFTGLWDYHWIQYFKNITIKAL